MSTSTSPAARKAEHTLHLTVQGPSKGRWDVEGDYALCDPAGQIVGEAFRTTGYGLIAPAEANARLWAAAPALLAALEEILEHPSAFSDGASRLWNQARAAIKLAEATNG